jgi:S-adenosylmethionine synthetase
MGRKNEVVTKTFVSPDGTSLSLDVELFTWEKTDFVERIQKEFGL